MASVLLLAAFLLCSSFPVGAQDTRTYCPGSCLREYVDKSYCTYTYVVPPGSRTGGCTPPVQLAETKEETGSTKNVDRLLSVVETFLSQQSNLTQELHDQKTQIDSLSNQLSEERARTAQLGRDLQEQETRVQNLKRDRQEQEAGLQAQVQNLSDQLSEERARSAQLEQNLTQALLLQEAKVTGLLDGFSAQLSEERDKNRELALNLTQALIQLDNMTSTECPCERPGENPAMTTSPTQPVSTAVVSANTETASNYPVVSRSKVMSPTESGSTSQGAGNTPTEVTTATTGPSKPSHVTTESTSSGTKLQVRLAGGPTPLAGRVEVRNGTGPWGSVCDDRWDLQDARVVCRQLGFGTALEAKLAGHFGEGSGGVWLDEVACGGDETNLGDCPAEPWGQSDCSHKEDAGVVCGGGVPVRLTGGRSPSEGRVEIRNGDWGTVCDDGFDDRDAQVVCRQLGYSSGVATMGGVYPEGTGDIWLEDLNCEGDESSVADCGFTKWGDHDCTHKEDAGVICTASDCAEYYAAGQTTSGVYNITLSSSTVEAYCDMDTAGGGWTVIQRRQDGSVPFNRNWEEYKRGFGNKSGEYWLGNENIHLLTNQKSYSLRVDMQGWDGETRYATYSSFRVSGESDQYRLHISGYSGTAGHSMNHNNGQKFSTVDRDNDIWSSYHCSQQDGQGGWWFGHCSNSYLNGRYLRNCGNSCAYLQGVIWNYWRGYRYSLKSVSMKIRP